MTPGPPTEFQNAWYEAEAELLLRVSDKYFGISLELIEARSYLTAGSFESALKRIKRDRMFEYAMFKMGQLFRRKLPQFWE